MNDLPTEVLSEIFEYCASSPKPYRNYRNLTDCQLVCRKWHRLSQKEFYKSFIFDYESTCFEKISAKSIGDNIFNRHGSLIRHIYLKFESTEGIKRAISLLKKYCPNLRTINVLSPDVSLLEFWKQISKNNRKWKYLEDITFCGDFNFESYYKYYKQIVLYYKETIKSLTLLDSVDASDLLKTVTSSSQALKNLTLVTRSNCTLSDLASYLHNSNLESLEITREPFGNIYLPKLNVPIVTIEPCISIKKLNFILNSDSDNTPEFLMRTFPKLDYLNYTCYKNGYTYGIPFSDQDTFTLTDDTNNRFAEYLLEKRQFSFYNLHMHKQIRLAEALMEKTKYSTDIKHHLAILYRCLEERVEVIDKETQRIEITRNITENDKKKDIIDISSKYMKPDTDAIKYRVYPTSQNTVQDGGLFRNFMVLLSKFGPSLTSLQISIAGIDNFYKKPFLFFIFKYCYNLKVLKIEYAEFIKRKCIPRLKNSTIEELVLSRCELNSKFLGKLPFLLPDLTSLAIQDCFYNCEEIKSLSIFPVSFDKLETLEIQTYVTINLYDPENLKNIKSIKTLKLESCSFTLDFVGELFTHLPSLDSLTLCEVKITDITTKKINVNVSRTSLNDFVLQLKERSVSQDIKKRQ